MGSIATGSIRRTRTSRSRCSSAASKPRSSIWMSWRGCRARSSKERSPAMPKHAFDHDIEERFVRYARIDSQADESSPSIPSTKEQFDLLNLLVDELKEMGA